MSFPTVEPNIVLPCYWERLIAKTQHLTSLEFGGYWRLLLHQWNKGSVPAGDVARLAQIMGCSPAVAKSIWKEIGSFFAEACPCGCGLVRNRRMEEVRQEQIKNIARAKSNGGKGGRPPNQKPTQNLNPNQTSNQNRNQNERQTGNLDKSPPSSEFRVPDPVPIGSSGSRVVPRSFGGGRALIISPLDFSEKHEPFHVVEFCEWMCFPKDLAQQFASRLAASQSITADEATASVLNWARGVRASGVVPTGRMYDFWNGQFERTHGSSDTPKDGAAGRHERTRQRLDRFVENG